MTRRAGLSGGPGQEPAESRLIPGEARGGWLALYPLGGMKAFGGNV